MVEKRCKIFDEDPQSLRKIIDEMRIEEENPFMAGALQKSLDLVEALPSPNSRALVMYEVIESLLDSQLVYLAKKFGEEALDSTMNVQTTSEKAKTLSRLSTTFSIHGFEEISQKIFKYGLMEAEKLEKDKRSVDVFISIAEEQLNREILGRAKKSLDLALTPALNLAEEGKDILPLSFVAELKARIRDEEAEEICQYAHRLEEEFADQPEDSWIKCSLVKAFLRLGEIEMAKPLVEEIRRCENTDIHMMELGMVLSEEGHSERAVEIGKDIENDELRDTLMRSIACGLVHDGLIRQALTLARTIENVFERDLIYQELIEKLLEEGDYKNIEKYLRMIEDEGIKSLTHKQIGVSYLIEDRFQKASDHVLKASRLARQSKKDSVKLEILDALIAIQGEKPALEFVEEINTTEERAIAYALIAAKSDQEFIRPKY